MNIKETIQKPEISFWMALIIPIVGIAIQWGVMTSTLSAMQNNHDRLRSEYDAHIVKTELDNRAKDLQLLQIEVKLAEIQKDISFIRVEIVK